jgi:hypothetical protein
MVALDPIALAIDWIDACNGRDIDALTPLYAENATLTLADPSGRGETVCLRCRGDIMTYWRRLFATNPDIAVQLVEIYPGYDSVVLVYYDQFCRRVSEFLRFGDDGRIGLSARHLIPRRLQDAVAASGAMGSRTDAPSMLKLRGEAMQNLIEARRLPPGPARNSLRQRAHALRQFVADRSSVQADFDRHTNEVGMASRS